MAELVAEITFLGMPSREKGAKPAPSAANLPGWKMISEGIKDAVNTCGLPVQTLADKTGLSRQYIYSMMAGTCNPTMDKVELIMEAAGTSLEAWLYERSAYGRDKRLHDQLQHLLNQKGESAVSLRTAIKAFIALSEAESEK